MSQMNQSCHVWVRDAAVFARFSVSDLYVNIFVIFSLVYTYNFSFGLVCIYVSMFLSSFVGGGF